MREPQLFAVYHSCNIITSFLFQYLLLYFSFRPFAQIILSVFSYYTQIFYFILSNAKDFMAFYDHVTSLPHCGEKSYTLDRINNDGNYEPGNVRWATRYEQNMNRRNTLKIDYNGQELNLIQVGKQYNIKYPTVLFHYHKGDLKEYIERKEKDGIKSA